MTSAAHTASWHLVPRVLYEDMVVDADDLIARVCELFRISQPSYVDAVDDMRHALLEPLHDPDWWQGRGPVANVATGCFDSAPSLICSDLPGRDPVHLNSPGARERLSSHLAFILVVLVSGESENEPLYSNNRKLAIMALQSLADADLG